MADELHIRGSGIQFRPSRFAPMPDKVRGKHRWIVIATYATSREALAGARRGDDVHLDQENLVALLEGCIDCEQAWPAPEPCPAGDEWGAARG